MLELRLHDGRTFRPEDAVWAITLPDGSRARWSDVALIRLIEAENAIFDGQMDGMPVRVLGFMDSSDLEFQVPLPLAFAREVGADLISKEIEVARVIPSSLVVARRKPLS